jgi:YidC/Oxa1 family membrane protein insertase
LTSKGNESMRKMQKVQPLFKELKEKYKDDPQLLNQKMTELYRKEGINPLAGCLPILLQIPIFFALYAMLDNAIALRHVSFLWAKNLAAADTVFSIPLGFTLPFANISAIPVNPLVLMMTALMIIQQRMTPNASMDPAQKRMMMMMPIIMLIFLYSLPSGLTLYWTVSNLCSIIQLWLQQKRNRALEAAANGKSK